MNPRFRIDPAEKGICLVDVENGGEQVYIPKDDIEYVIKLLREVE